MFLDWKNQYCENDYTTQSNLQIQCNPYQITNGIFFNFYFFIFYYFNAILVFLHSFLFTYVCMYVWLCWVFVSVRGLSLVVANGGHSSSRCTGLLLSRPLIAKHRLQTRRLSNCGSQAELLRGMWDLPRPGLEPVSPALAGRLSTTAPPVKPTNGIFYGTRTNHLHICMETQKTPNSQSSLEGKKRNWRNQTPWLQTILQSYSNQDNMVLAQKQKHRSMEQDRKPRD